MHIIKPSWLSHSGEQKDFEVYSCHVSPDGRRLATAGGDGHVRIWSTEAIYRANENSDSMPRQLCHMCHHLGTIHTVRFSPSGRYLASGADDKLICVYFLDKTTSLATFATGEPALTENWKTYKRLIGHENDVQDLAWSYDSSLLVSVGLDSKVVVWSGHTFEKLKTLNAHQSHVKGITFDPANKFFATASDDRTIKIFRFSHATQNATQHDVINNYVLETTISSPFKSSPLTTYFRRCSWSPDGNHIAAANAVNGPVSSIAIIERTRWDSEINLIGHEAPTEVCVFSPRLFHTEDPSTSNFAINGSHRQLVTVIASAGQDKTLSIWNTNTSRPVIILQDLTGKSISDLSWAPDGQTLFASSLDGSIVVARFDEGELGWVAHTEENLKALQKYGTSRKGMALAEDVEGLMLEIHSEQLGTKAVETKMGSLMSDLQHASLHTTPEPDDCHDLKVSSNCLEASLHQQKQRDSLTKQESKIVANRVNDLKSRVMVDKDGKKRVIPMLVSALGTEQPSLPQTHLSGSLNCQVDAHDPTSSILDLTKPYEGLPEGGIASILLGNKRKSDLIEGESGDDLMSKRPVTATAFPSTEYDMGGFASFANAEGEDIPIPEFLRPAILNPSTSFAQVRLAIPKIRSRIVRPLDQGMLVLAHSPVQTPKLPLGVFLEANNEINVKEPSHVFVRKQGALVWEEFLPTAVILLTASKIFWAAACEDGSIHVWTPAGRRLLNPIVVDSQPVILDSREQWLLCITSTGLTYVWNIRLQSAPQPVIPLAPILENATMTPNHDATSSGPGITSAHLNSTGHVVVTLTNGDGYFYAREMHVWQRLSEAWWAVGSQYWNSNDTSVSALQTTAVEATDCTRSEPSGATVYSGIIPYLEQHTTNEFLLKGRAYAMQRIVKAVLQRKSGEDFENSVSTAHLENRIAGALQLGAKAEFRRYILMYTRRLGAEGAKLKVEELLSSLMGGTLSDAHEEVISGKIWYGKDDEICGWDRNELLKEIILILGKYDKIIHLGALLSLRKCTRKVSRTTTSYFTVRKGARVRLAGSIFRRRRSEDRCKVTSTSYLNILASQGGIIQSFWRLLRKIGNLSLANLHCVNVNKSKSEAGVGVLALPVSMILILDEDF